MYVRLGHSTDVANILLVIVSGFILLFQLWEGINHQTTNNATKHCVHKGGIYGVKEEAHHIKGIHFLSYGSSSPKSKHAVDNILAGLLWKIILPENRCVCIEGYHIEDKNKNCSKEGEED